MAKKCLVLLCTYNGETYLREQLDTVLAQEGVETHIRCADDCSSDATVDILAEYAARYPDRVSYTVNPQNKRFTYNFIDLFFSTADTDYDYYAFCDQDDHWLPSKISAAVAKIEGTDGDPRGVLYCSNLIVADEKLTKIGMQESPAAIAKVTRRSILTENIATGCTIVVDRVFHRHALLYYPQGIELHDYWFFLIAVFTARAVYDPDAYILYRQHGTNQIGTNKRKWTRANIKKFFRMHGKQGALMRELINGYGEWLSPIDRKRMEDIRDYQTKFWVRMKLLFNPKFRKRNHNLILKLRVLTGKL